jgi:hypothetical protein
MELDTIREATSCAATQEFLSNLWTAKVHYRIYRICALLLINAVHTTLPYLFKVPLNIIPTYVLLFLVVYSALVFLPIT